MSRTETVRENLLHVEAQALAQNCHQHPPHFPTSAKTMEARLPQEKTVTKRHRGHWPILKSPITEILVFLVLCRVNWRVQGNSCVYYCEGQGEDDSENPACAFRRHHEYAWSECPVQLHWPEILRLVTRSSQIIAIPILSQTWLWLVSTHARLWSRVPAT
jgi:hypothetical protein